MTNKEKREKAWLLYCQGVLSMKGYMQIVMAISKEKRDNGNET